MTIKLIYWFDYVGFTNSVVISMYSLCKIILGIHLVEIYCWVSALLPVPNTAMQYVSYAFILILTHLLSEAVS